MPLLSVSKLWLGALLLCSQQSVSNVDAWTTVPRPRATTTTTTRRAARALTNHGGFAQRRLLLSDDEDDNDDGRKAGRRRFSAANSNNGRRTIGVVLRQSSSSTTSGSSTATRSSSSLLPPITLYNSLTRQKEVLQATFQHSPDHFSMYTCGPTVYDYAHVGNFRAFLTYDVLKRTLLYFGYRVTHICNITDVDDKIIARAAQLRLRSALELTRKFEDRFRADLLALNVVSADGYPRATDHVEEMMDMVQTLAEKRLAYETADGSWYFRTRAQEGYGQQLVQQQQPSQQQSQQQQQQQSEDDDTDTTSDKEHDQDFCLWKAYKPGMDRDDLVWERLPRIAKGRPGWHLECSAMARKYLGDVIDLHGGGIDLKFPHHENEIAQSQGVTGKRPFCRCWFHNGFVNIGSRGEKMSKSLGNFVTLSQACPSASDVRAYRYLVVSSQYRNPLTFSPAAMEAAKGALRRMDAIQSRLSRALQDYNNKDDNDHDSTTTTTTSNNNEDKDNNVGQLAKETVPKALENFEAALKDDLSMPRAAAALFGLVKAAENEFKRVAKQQQQQPSSSSQPPNNDTNNDDDDATAAASSSSSPLDLVGLAAIQSALQQMDRVFGIFYQVPDTHNNGDNGDINDGNNIPDEVLELVNQRSAAKESKDWELADSLRARITELGFSVKDVKGGEPIVSRVE